jgi:benzoyl-CoA reductase/2-hydroxyglutaryl-CoA dehydratase subunit BcrC/BadD/HgdB
MEVITCQWEGLKLTIYAAKYISSKYLITYIKGSFAMPKGEAHCASFAALLTEMLLGKDILF